MNCRTVAPHGWARRRAGWQNATLQHLTATAGADIDRLTGELMEAILPPARQWSIGWRRCGQQIAAERELLAAMAVGKEADVADAMEAVRHGVLQESADEFVGGERHDLGLAVLSIVLPDETDIAIVKSDQPAVGDGDTVGITAEITEDLFGSRERGFAKDHPVDLSQRVDVGGEAGGGGQRGERAGEAELTIGKGGAKHLQEQVAEAAGEHADGQEEAGWTSDPARLIGRDPPARHQAMQVWMVCHR